MKRWNGFTLVELLVVIAIIGVLIALILPAIQSAREASRRAECKSHIKQMSLGIISFVSAQKRLPSGGWGFNWIGDPDRGTGKKQPGGWFYSILPFIEQQALARIGRGLEAGDPTTGSPKSIAMQELMKSPVPIYFCPSRRAPMLYKNGNKPYNSDFTDTAAKIDYAGNGGDNNIVDSTQAWQPLTFVQGDDPTYWTNFPESNGVWIACSELPLNKITDGLSKTYLMGEKNLSASEYEVNASDYGDNHSAWTGLNWNMVRTTSNSVTGQPYNYLPPQQDRKNFVRYFSFGSAHPSSCGMSFCDGSVHDISYNIDPEINRRLGNRHDGLPIDASKY